MKKITNSERWLGKRKKDLNEEELKEYFKLSQRERRRRPDVQEYIKKYNREYVAKNRTEIYKKNREWQKRNPEKMKSYKNSKLKREIAVLEKALELACKYKLPEDGKKTIRFMDTGIQIDKYKDLIEYAKEQARKEMMKSE